MSSPAQVQLSLTSDEALVLHELLQRFSGSGALNLEDQAEERALWNLCCLLEKELLKPLSASYPQALEAARSRLRDPAEGNK